MLYKSKRVMSIGMLMSIVLGTLLAACGGTGSAGSSSANGCSDVQVTYWNGFSGPDGPVMTQLVKSFNSSHQGNIQVTMTIVPLASYATKLDTAAASDTLPDVAIVNEDQVATQAFRHVIQPMDAISTQLGYTSNDFPAVAWKTDNFAGHQYGVPLSIAPLTMYYNADLLKKAGLSGPPTNADEFARAAAAMTAGGNRGFQITAGFPVQQIFQQLLHQFGGSEFNADATQATWNSAAGVQALQWMKDAQARYSKPKLPVDADVNSFKAGTVGMIWNGIWQATNVTGDSVDFNGQAAAIPQIGTQAATWAGMPSLALPAHKKALNKCIEPAAATFIKYLVDNSDKWSQAGNLPAYNKARSSSTVASLKPQGALVTAVETPIFPPSVPGIADAFAPLGDAVGAIMAGTSNDIQKTLNSAASRADQILSQNKQKYGTTPTNS